MSVDMISVKTLIDWVPTGRQYYDEFGAHVSDRLNSASKRTANDSVPLNWQSRKVNGVTEELYFGRNWVVWAAYSEISNRYPSMVFETDTPVVSADWVSFFIPSRYCEDGYTAHISSESCGHLQRGIAIFEAERLTFIDADGEHYSVRLPCRLANAWPMDTVVLLQRQPTAEESSSIPNESGHRHSSDTPPLFTLFSLSHPLDEAAPVLLKVPLPDSGFGISFASDVDLKIVAVITSLNLVLTLHTSTGLHSLWRLEKAEPEDYISLYELGDDGRACVAPYALNHFVHRSENNLTKTPLTSVVDRHCSRSFATPSFKQVNDPAVSGRVCLSPFAASLRRLTVNQRLGVSSNESTGLSAAATTQCVSPNPTCPFTPVSLAAHINRLSSVQLARPNSLASTSVANLSQTTIRRSSVTGLQTHVSGVITPGTSRLHTILPSATPDLTQSPGASNMSNRVPCDTPVSAISCRSALNPDQLNELIAEPLLPKICLRLVWTEPPAKGGSKSKRVRWDSVTDKDTTTICTGIIPGSTPNNSSNRPSFSFLRANRKLVSYLQPPLTTEFAPSPLTLKSVNVPKTWAESSLLSSPRVTRCCQTTSAQSHPTNTRAFLALDMVSLPWICFLTGSSQQTGRPSSLACIQSAFTTVSVKNQVSSERLVYLTAVDAVYIPSSRLTACLEPGTGIVLYTGVQKICILGVTPPPVISTYSAITNSAWFDERFREIQHSFHLPFVVRPSAPELDRWKQNAVTSVLSGVLDLLRSPLKGAESSRCNDAAITTENDDIKELCAEASIPSTADLTTTPLTESSAFCDPVGNSFILTLPCDGVCRNGQSDRLLRVYLPSLAQNELVQRCLVGLHQILPRAVSSHIFARWYVFTNAPGSCSSLSPARSSTDVDHPLQDYFVGPPEWISFVIFVLDLCGLSVFDANGPESQRDTSFEAAQKDTNGGSGECSRKVKRRHAVEKQPCDSDWCQLLESLDGCSSCSKTEVDPILFRTASPVQSQRVAYCGGLQLHLSRSIRTDPIRQLISPHLPDILLAFHLVYEEARLNSILSSELLQLAELNFIISRVLDLRAYASYYTLEWPALRSSEPILEQEIPHSSFIWPPYMPTGHAPCLLNWLIRILEVKSVNPPFPESYVYCHLHMVNDLAVTLAGMFLSAVHVEWATQFSSLDSEQQRGRFIDRWRGSINLVTRPNFNSNDNPSEMPKEQGGIAPTLPKRSSIDAKSGLALSTDPFENAFVDTLLSSSKVYSGGESVGNSATNPRKSTKPCSPQNLALLFLSQLSDRLPRVRVLFLNRLGSLSPGLSAVLRIVLSRSRSSPPPNCSPHVYSLMGRSDLARQAELSVIKSKQPPKEINKEDTKRIKSSSDQPDSLQPSSLQRLCPYQSSQIGALEHKQATWVRTSSSWSTAEIWANSVRPFRDPPSSSSRSAGGRSRAMLMSRHALLSQLEENASCQISFKNDLRLREAYRLLQSSSHIRLPRLSTEGAGSATSPTAGSTDQGSRITESRLEMHLAAAGIRVWASAVGRGMLGLHTLIGSRVPTQLRVTPICLRGRAVSPSSGRRVLVDLARDPLPSSASADITGGGGGRTGAAVSDLGGIGAETASGIGDRRVGTTNGVTNDVGVTPVVEVNDASNHPGNAMALAVASAVASSGAGSALRTAALDLPRMIPRSVLMSSYSSVSLSAIASNSASSTASLLSTANLQQTPAVLAAKSWPDFHNGVAVGLSISPHASVDATWIMYNCRSAGGDSDTRRGNGIRTTPESSLTDPSTPEQAGLLLGLGLNGHLNKITPYDIGEYLVRVHDLHNMAVLLGLCAGKRGSMDQSVLRLLAVHYRPLLPSDPLVHVQLSVPSLCQAAAVFGLGLLYQGSAHRHITNLLITELGRSLSGNATTGGCRRGFQSDSDSQQVGGSNNFASGTGSTANGGLTGAAGTGGFAGDSCELIALSAGLALGLVLLQRGDSPCGLSDLPWAEKLHAYMVGGPRESDNPRPDLDDILGRDSACLLSAQIERRIFKCSTTHRPTSGGVNTINSALESSISDRPGRTDVARLLNPSRTSTSALSGNDALMGDSFLLPALLGTERRYTNADRSSLSTETARLMGPSGSGRVTGRIGAGVSPNSSLTYDNLPASTSDFTGRPIDRRIQSDLGSLQANVKNPQIRELHCYNKDVSAPGAIMALGMAYLDTKNATISAWLVPSVSLAQIEQTRPDFFMFRALAHGLVNWQNIKPDMEWVRSFCPNLLLERMQRLTEPRSHSAMMDLQELQNESMLAELSSEDDVENRCPDLITTVRQATGRSTHMIGAPIGGRGRTASRRTRVHGNRRLSSVSTSNNATRAKLARDIDDWQDQFNSDSVGRLDEAAVSLSYLNILVGRAFALGLRFAGTCHPEAASVLYDITQSILRGLWWPPLAIVHVKKGSNKTSLPKLTLESAAAQCLLALAMVLAGSGNLTVLRLVRQLRAITLFRSKSDNPNPRSASQSQVISHSRLHSVASAAARAAATTQAAASSTSGVSSGPISVASVFGVALGPSFGLHIIYGCIIGLLFLGGGRLTLSNTPESAAILAIAFLPILPGYPGDNWYHLQALRHFYVLATRPRRLCAVDVDTGRVVLSNMRAKVKATNEMVSSEDTIIIPTNGLDELSWVEVNHGSEKYWPTVFHNGTTNWEQLRFAFNETGYLYVKRKDTTDESKCLKSWIGNSLQRWSDLRVLKQLKLLVFFLRRFPAPSPANGANQRSTRVQDLDLSRALSASVTQHFVDRKRELAGLLQQHYLGVSIPPANGAKPDESDVLKAFLVWFGLPSPSAISPCLTRLSSKPTLADFVKAVHSSASDVSPASLFWLYSFLYTIDDAISAPSVHS
ncbi:unnamed protein product [Calicophoron daubneyi]|uniref:Anaphase-promoting complex subunit 1 middle domain-containing protein n=1 Tax=Calicophoron daubneyi TaxID=300641 RepID=A0AAV2TVD0_CALDB